MALSKIQTFIQKLSESQNVKKVLGDIQRLSNDLQKKVQTLNANDAVRKYKEIVKKASQAEGELEKEVNKVVVKIKKSAADVKKDLLLYKKKAVQQKNDFEKILKSKNLNSKSAATVNAAPKARKAVKRTAKKKSVSKATKQVTK